MGKEVDKVVEGETELERTLGLKEALSIGIGTMIGAGIFIFPGLASGKAGLAASASFLIGAVIALLVALPASELATAMPKSGGGYYFVSRGFGAFLGNVVGLSLWAGLVFAASFYLVGFGQYANSILSQFGFIGIYPNVLGLLLGFFLTIIAIIGTTRASELQNAIVGSLLVILFLFLFYGVLDSLGFFGRTRIPETFAPHGYLNVFTTAALVFTSYLGFAQIATIAGEIKKPGKNLPLAMVVSVLIVAVSYVLTIFVATSVFGSAKLGEFGETALVFVARELLGFWGALFIMVAGLLATVSSANASIIGSSRTIYALSRDKLLPKTLSKISKRFGTPYISLLMAGGPIIFLVSTGRVEVLAEVASFLHLFMYGLICFSLISLRRERPEWYDPDFVTPLYPVIPLLGGFLSFSLILFMKPLSQIVGVSFLIGAGLWYLLYGSKVELKGVKQ